MSDYTELITALRSTESRSKRVLLESAADAIEQLVKERDAAIHDLDMAVCGQESYPCQYCANYGIAPINVDDVCKTCTDCENWEWRGVLNADS